MMDWLTNYLPDGSDLYWAILCTALAVGNVWQFAHAHGLTVFKKLAETQGHAPEGKAIVPADNVKVRTDEIERLKAETAARSTLPPLQSAPPPPWEKQK